MKVFAVCALVGVITLVGLAGPVLAQGLGLWTLRRKPACGLDRSCSLPPFDSRNSDTTATCITEATTTIRLVTSSSTLSPSVDVSLRSSHVRVERPQPIRSLLLQDVDRVETPWTATTAAQVDLLLNRRDAVLSGGITDTRQRQNLEIDAIAKRQTNDVTVGAAVRLTGKTSVDDFRASVAPRVRAKLSLSRHRPRAGSQPHVVGCNCRRPLRGDAAHHVRCRGDAGTCSVRLGSSIEIQQSCGSRPSVEFSPFALVSGRASIGFYKRTFSADSAQSTCRRAVARRPRRPLYRRPQVHCRQPANRSPLARSHSSI